MSLFNRRGVAGIGLGFLCLALMIGARSASAMVEPEVELRGVTVTPHFALDNMRYILPTPPAAGARTQLFLINRGTETLKISGEARTLFNGRSPAELLRERDWAWHDTPSAAPGEDITLAPGELTVWTFNSRTADYGPGARVRIELGPDGAPWLLRTQSLDRPRLWISAVTFLGPSGSTQPDTMVVHLANESGAAVKINGCRLWLPRDPKQPRALAEQPPLSGVAPFNGCDEIPSGDRGGFTAATGPLPLTYAAVEVTLTGPDGPVSLWAHLRVKKESFDISGGWVNDEWGNIKSEDWLKTLARLHVNTAHYSGESGYSDGPLYERYPLKYNGELWPPDKFDTDEILPRVHAVEDLGEPQYGGGRPVPPQEVWTALHRYAPTRLPTSLTNSEERIWRDYAGLSDYPHYDAYRVTAPSADEWRRYDRWGWQRIGWGAPLETIGDMSRSLRELNRPMPCAYWSQAPHEGWRIFDGRLRASPTPAEIRSQAWHAVSTRITSLYWFNLRPRALALFRDTIEELGRTGRELMMLDEFILEGDAYRHQRKTKDGRPDWDLASVCGPRAALLFALDLDYSADPVERVFKFGPPRPAVFRFPLPGYLAGVADVFRIDADGPRVVSWSFKDGAVEVADQASLVAIYVASPDPGLRERIEQERKLLVAREQAINFDPAGDDEDFARLRSLVKKPFDLRLWFSRRLYGP